MGAAWDKANRDKMNAYQRAYALKNKEKIAVKNSKHYREKPEVNRENCRKYNSTHREQRKIAARKRYASNKEQWRLYCKNRRARKRGGTGTVTLAQWYEILALYSNRCLRCKSKKDITMDHVIPLSKGGNHVVENLQPLCMDCNRRKGTKTVDYRTNPASLCTER